MKIVKRILIGLLALILIGFLLPSSYKVERSQIIKAAPGTINSLVNDLHVWPKWSPWFHMDTAMVVKYLNGGMGQGAGYTWESKKMGIGKLEIIESSLEEIKTKISFNNRGSGYGTFRFEPQDKGTKVTWTMSSNGEDTPIYMKPFSNYMALFMDKMLGSQFEKGLDDLSLLATSIAPPMPKGLVQSVEIKEAPSIQVLQIEDHCPVIQIGRKLSELYGRIGKAMANCGVTQASAPMAKYPGMHPQDTATKIVAMIPTDKLCKGKLETGIKAIVIPTMKVILANYVGPYETNYMAYEAIEKYMKENKFESAGEPYEEYANDPLQSKDPSTYITNVYWPVKKIN